MVGPEKLQQLLIADDSRLKDNAHRLAVIADIPVIRIDGRATGIAGGGINNPCQTPEPGVDAPESTEGKQGDLVLRIGRFQA